MASAGKTPLYCYSEDPLKIFGHSTSRGRRHLYQQRESEDVLDFCHRLAKLGCRPQTIAGHTGLPLESVEYVLIRNGYPQGKGI